jgi:hypothetical protein
VNFNAIENDRLFVRLFGGLSNSTNFLTVLRATNALEGARSRVCARGLNKGLRVPTSGIAPEEWNGACSRRSALD